MTTEQKIAYLKADLRKTDQDAEPVPARVNLETPFNLVGQFTSSTVPAVMARNAEVRPQPARTPTKVLGRFDARQFGLVSVHKLFPDANDADYSDDSDDDTSAAAHIQRCKNHLEQCDSEACERAPTDGSLDHMALAHRHLTEALEMRARAGRLAAVGQQHATVRFA